VQVGGGLVVISTGWALLRHSNDEEADKEGSRECDEAAYARQAFYPLTLPLTTGPGTIAVMISLGLSRGAQRPADELLFIFASLAAVAVIAFAIGICFSYAHRMQRFLGPGGTDIAVRLTAFILFTLGMQIIWSGANELLISVLHPGSIPAAPKPLG